MASKETFAQVPELDLVPVGLWLPLVLTGQSLSCQMPDSLRARQPLWEISPVQVHRCPLVHIPGSPKRGAPQALSTAPGLPGVSCRGMAPGSVFSRPEA